MGVKKVPAVGKLCHVHWTDVVGYINVSASEVTTAKVVSVGYIHKISKDFIVIASAYYQDDDTPHDRREGDFTALPLGMINRIDVI